MYKDMARSLHSQIDETLSVLLQDNQTVQDDLEPVVVKRYKHLKKEMRTQKDENELLYKQLLQLKKESAALSQKVEWADQKVSLLEGNVGVEKDDQQDDPLS